MRLELKELIREVGGHNPGFLWSRCATSEELRGEGRLSFLKRVATTVPHATYRKAFARYQESVQDWAHFTAETRSPLAVGLGSHSALEIGLHFSKPYGMPTIPGSSLKGAVRRQAARMLGIEQSVLAHYQPQIGKGDLAKVASRETFDAATEAWLDVFGSPDAAGAFDILDAWLLPTTSEFLMLDTITVHHREYYQGKTNPDPPLDSDDPIPNAFICVRPGQKFLFAYRGATDSLEAELRKALKVVLEDRGVGAKTSAGYGRFKLLAD